MPVAESYSVVPFGKYLLDQEIARGGMARVYLARLRGLGGFEKRLVVKQVLPELASDPRFVEMFVQEAKTLVQMSHPHIVPVYELGIVHGIYFLAMEYVEGSTLAEVLADGRLTPAQAAHVGVGVADALSYAHERFGLVHRDVTPRNVMLDAEGHARLLDFGIAAPANSEHEGVFGSHGYMSPEQARAGNIDARSDLFSLGTLIYEALSGSPAFRKASNKASDRALLSGEPPADLPEHVPEELRDLVSQLLQPDREDRPESANATLRALRSWLARSNPEGIGPELGSRVEGAKGVSGVRRTPAKARAGESGGSDSGSGGEEGQKTLATSARFRQLHETLDSDEPADPPSDSSAEPQGTVPIEGRRSRADSEEPTQPLRTPVRKSSKETPKETPKEESVDSPSSRWWLGLLAAAAVVGLGVFVLSTEPSDDATVSDPQPNTPSSMDTLSEPDPVPTSESLPTMEEIVPPPSMVEPGMQQEAPVQALRGLVTVTATPWAQVRLGNRSLGTTPIRAASVPAGAHTLVVENPPLGRTVRVPIRVESGDNVRVRVDLSVDPPRVVRQ